MRIEIAGIPIEITKKKVKNINISVSPPDGRVRVSVPARLSYADAEAFVRSKIDWIAKQRTRFRMRPEQAAPQYVTGETLYVWGEPYRLRVESAGKNALVLVGEEAVLSVRAGSTPAQRERCVKEWYRALLKTEIERSLPQWEAVTGLYCSGWQTKYMTTRWGTCNTRTKKIWLNVQLAQKPRICLEYVILHELAHLRIKNHGKDFAVILDTYMPQWRAVRKLLR